MKRIIVHRAAAPLSESLPALPAPAKPLKPLVMPPDEAADKLRLEREHRMRELAWTHMEAAHTRFETNTAAGHLESAKIDSEAVSEWMSTFRYLVQEAVGTGGDDDESEAQGA